jgi:hypothetical protein
MTVKKMRLYIRQKGNNYRFFENDNEQEILTGYWDRKRKVGLFSKIVDVDDSELVTVTLTKSPWFWELSKATYRIEIHKEHIQINVKAVNYHKGHWTFNINGDKYDFYFHSGHKKSLFKNDKQVAKYNKGQVQFWTNDSGYVIANNNESKLLLLSLFIMFDMGEYMGADVNVDLGKLNNGVIENNEHWTPTK